MIALARYTFLESLRDRMYVGFLVAMTLLVVLLAVAGSAPWGLNDLVVQRLGWMAVDVLIALQTSIYAVSNLYREREKRIIYNHLTTPVGRVGYLLGKTLGLLAVQLALAVVGALVIMICARYLTYVHAFAPAILWIIPSVLFKNAVLLAYAMLLAQFATDALTATLFTLGVYLMGNGVNEILELAAKIGGAAEKVASLFYYLVPNLQFLDFEQAALYRGGVPLPLFFQAFAYCGAYVTLALVTACLFFNRKDL